MIATNAKTLRAAIVAARNQQTTRHAAVDALNYARIVAEDGHALVQTTDLEAWNGETIDADGSGVHYLPIAQAKKILAAIGDERIEIDAAGDKVAISSPRGRFTLATIPDADYPAQPAAPTGTTLEIPAGLLANMLERAIPAASTDEMRPVLTGVLLEIHDDYAFTLVGCDSYRLHIVEHGERGRGDGERILIPGRFARAVAFQLKRGGLVTIAANSKHVEVHVGAWHGTARVIEGTYPDWRRLIPQSAEIGAALPAAATLAALKMAATVATGNTPVRLALARTTPSRLRVEDPTMGEFSVDLDVAADLGTWDGAELGFNGEFFADTITAAQSDTPLLHCIAPDRPAWITSIGCHQCGTPIDGHGVAFTGLLMPIRLG